MNRALCGARARSGNPCGRPAGWGTCKLHGGSTSNAGKAAAKLEAAHQALRVRDLLDVPAEVDPLDALMHCLAITAGEVTYCDHMLALLSTEAELALPVLSARVQYRIYRGMRPSRGSLATPRPRATPARRSDRLPTLSAAATPSPTCSGECSTISTSPRTGKRLRRRCAQAPPSLRLARGRSTPAICLATRMSWREPLRSPDGMVNPRRLR